MSNDNEMWNAIISNFKKVNTELQAHINELREALEVANRLDYVREHPAIANIVGKALAKTPAQSLQAHDDELITLINIMTPYLKTMKKGCEKNGKKKEGFNRK